MLILMISLCTTVIAILLEGPVQRYLKNRPPPVSFARQFRLSRRQTPQNEAQTVSFIRLYMSSVNLQNREDARIQNPSEPPFYFSSLFEDRSLIPLMRNMPNLNLQQTFSAPAFYESPPSYEECNFESLKENLDKTSITFSV